MAYWQGGKCFLHGSNQSHTAAVPNIARYIGIKPKDLVFIAEYCGGGFGSKIPGYPIMAIAGAAVEEAQPAGDACASRASRNTRIGSARPGFQGHVKLGFREDGKLLAADLYIVQENGPHIGGGDFRSAGNALSLVYQPMAMRFRAIPVLTNTPLRRSAARSGREPARAGDRADDRQGGAPADIDRVEIRMINAPDSNGKIGADHGPVTSAFLKEALDKGAAMFNWDEKKQRSGQKNGTKVTGIGIGQGYHSAGSNGFDGLRAHHPRRQAARPYRRRQSRHLLALGDRPGRRRTCSMSLGRTSSSSAATAGAACPGTSPRPAASPPRPNRAPTTSRRWT